MREARGAESVDMVRRVIVLPAVTMPQPSPMLALHN